MYFMEKLNRKRSEHFNDEKTAFLKNLFTFCGNEGTTYLESVNSLMKMFLIHQHSPQLEDWIEFEQFSDEN